MKRKSLKFSDFLPTHRLLLVLSIGFSIPISSNGHANYANYANLHRHVRSPLSSSPSSSSSPSLSVVNDALTDQSAAKHQLRDWAAGVKEKDLDLGHVTNYLGRPVPSLTASRTIGSRGPVLLSDTNFIDHLAHFDRERIPERVVHAKGCGAHGYFELLGDTLVPYTKAAIFSPGNSRENIGKKTPTFMRFSTVGGESGSPDTLHDPRGFAIKFYTSEGVWNLVGNNIPVFPIRDPILFPSLIRSRKRNPKTHLRDVNMWWDFTSLRPESTLHTLFLFSDTGFPDGVRAMHGFGVHTFKLVNALGQVHYCKFHWVSQQGLRNMTQADAGLMNGINPDYSTEDLYNAIKKGDFPSWDLYVQIMTPEQAQKYRWNPFDITKLWEEDDYKLMGPVGRLTLDRNPKDYFAEVEQAAFDPGDTVPGVEIPEQDPMFHGRSFSYNDAQRYRLGPNFQQLPINRPKFSEKYTYMRDGLCNAGDNGDGGPNYFPNSFSGPDINQVRGPESSFVIEGVVDRVDTNDDDDFSQPKLYWDRQTPDHQSRIIDNLANVIKMTETHIQNKAIENFEKVDPSFGKRLRESIQAKLKMI